MRLSGLGALHALGIPGLPPDGSAGYTLPPFAYIPPPDAASNMTPPSPDVVFDPSPVNPEYGTGVNPLYNSAMAKLFSSQPTAGAPSGSGGGYAPQGPPGRFVAQGPAAKPGPGAGAFIKAFADLFGNAATGYAKIEQAQLDQSMTARQAAINKKFPPVRMTPHASDNSGFIIGGGLLAAGVLAVLLLGKKKKK